MKPTFSVNTAVSLVADNSSTIAIALKALARNIVLVGVPQEKTPRSDGKATNSLLAYVHNYGSPTQNIPARPFMEPGIRDAKDQIDKRLQDAARAALEGRLTAMTQNLTAAGIVASTSIKKKISSNIPPPLAPATIAARRRRGRTGTKTLIDTGQLRNAITFVVRSK